MKTERERKDFWDIYNKAHLKAVLKAKKPPYRTYQYFVDVSTGELKMRPEAFKNTNILLSCDLKAKTAKHHKYGVHLY